MPVVDLNVEINRLRDLMPASGRMKTRLLLSDAQGRVIVAPMPRPWQQTSPITLNPGLWMQLALPQRDLLYLRTVCWLMTVNLVKPGWYQGAIAAGALGTLVEAFQGDAIGLLAAGGLAALAGTQLWRSHRGMRAEIAADNEAIRVAQRRGYSESEAAQALLSAIEAVPSLEGYSGLSVNDLLRCQNLRSLVQPAPTPAPY